MMNSLELCFTDYSTDQRGDVGSWVRTATMDLVNYLLPCISRLDSTVSDQQPYLHIDTTTHFIAALLKQSVERIDKVRSNAGKVLGDLILSSEYLNFPGQDYLRQCIKRYIPQVAFPLLLTFS